MKLFSKFKQFSREIKLIIITTLIVSCVGVYAAGECIISATADDVTYNNTTVQAAIDELYSMSDGYCQPGYECKKLSLYRIMADNSVLDNTSSTYVTSSSGIDFSQISSNTNGKGIYEIASTNNDTYPIYYYRGAVDNNNVKFGGFCWKAIRTTDTGGVKLIYNGTPNASGNCTNTTGTSTQIGTSGFGPGETSPAEVGYMYGSAYSYYSKDSSNLNAAYKYGKSVTYSGGTYTLTNVKTATGTWSNDYNTLNNNHYTCFTTGTTCSTVNYLFFTDSNVAYYITLTGGKTVEDALDEMFNANDVNTSNSPIKNRIDTWYSTNLSSYSSYIEDTIYCNDRSISILGAWDPNGGNTSNGLYFGSYARAATNYAPSLICSRAIDRFTVSLSKGNGALTYPVGLITSDEAIYAGGKSGTSNSTYYLYTNQSYWTMSPTAYGSYLPTAYRLVNSGSITSYDVFDSFGIRPVISINSLTEVDSGDGTSTNPYVIKTN